jgi:hypothetical protein
MSTTLISHPRQFVTVSVDRGTDAGRRPGRLAAQSRRGV